MLQILQEARAGTAVKVLCAKHNISPATFHAWKRKFGGMEVDEVRRLRALTEENARLKRLVAVGRYRFFGPVDRNFRGVFTTHPENTRTPPRWLTNTTRRRPGYGPSSSTTEAARPPRSARR